MMDIQMILDATGGTLLTAAPNLDRPISGVVWDSREVKAGSVFVTMIGERVDGNDYVIPAIEAGAACVLLTVAPDAAVLAIAGEFDCALIEVTDPVVAMRHLAGAYRQTLSAQVIGVTGSTGKTTTKNLIASVLSVAYETVATAGNQNNEIGVPATVLKAKPDTQKLVVEMGMRALGQLTDLCSFVKPSIGVITNIGVTHMELLGSQENIARAKGELVSALPEDGCAILCGDDPFSSFILDNCPHAEGLRVITFGTADSCDLCARDIKLSSEGLPSFSLVFPGGEVCAVALNLPGKHNVMNALAAAAVGFVAGMTLQDIVSGLQLVHPGNMRFEVLHTKAGVTVINDAYNANPDSMRAALQTLHDMDVAGRRIAVLGDMGELGERSSEFHHDIGVFAAQSGLELLICVGELSRTIAQAASETGMSDKRIVMCANVEEALEYLVPVIDSGDAVLVKASRSMELERIVKGIVD